jgi:membrane protein required for colicin V production
MNWTDYAIIALLLASCIVGLVRGLLREVISAITWVAAVWLAWEFADVLEPHLGGALREAAVRPWAARTIIFVLVLVVGAGIGAVVSYFVRLSIFNSLDRLLGLVFGLLRGVVVLGVLAMLCHAVRLNEETWYRESTLVPYAEQAGNVLRGLVGERKIRASPLTA